MSSCPPLRLFVLALLLLAAPCGAQDPAVAPPPTLEGVRASLEKLKADESVEVGAKDAATKHFEEALVSLEAAAAFTARSTAAKALVESGPKETAALEAEIERRRAGQIPEAAKEAGDLPAVAGPEALDARIAAERSRAAELARTVRERETELSELQSRPAANRERLVEVTRLLAEAERGTESLGAASTGWQEEAETAATRAHLLALQAELASLEQENLALDTRRNLLQARRDLASSDLELARARVTRLEDRSERLVEERIGEVERLIDELGLKSIGGDPRVESLLTESTKLGAENKALLDRIAAADATLIEANATLDRIQREAEGIRAQVELGGLESSFAEVALELRNTLPTAESKREEVGKRRHEISAARLASFHGEQALAEASSTEGVVEELVDALRTKGASEEELARLRPRLLEFVANGRKLRRDALESHRRLADVLSEIDLVESEVVATAKRLRDYLGERLVWVASSPPLSKDAFTGLRTALRNLGGPTAVAAKLETLGRVGWMTWGLGLLLAGVLFAPRRRLRHFLEASARRTRRISVDSVGNTVSALVASLWLALPGPVLMAFFGWLFSRDPFASSATIALGRGLLELVVPLSTLRFASVLCWPGGVAEAHFRWSRETVEALHRMFIALILFYLPARLLLAIWWQGGGDLAAFQGPGRLVFVLAMVALALILRRWAMGAGGLGSPAGTANPPRRRGWKILPSLLVAYPLVLAALAAAGYFLGAMALESLLRRTAYVALGSVLLYAFLTRGAGLKGRRMALAEALAEREARRTAAKEDKEVEGEPAAASEDLLAVEEEEPLDWATVGGQTRHFLRVVVTLLAVFGCWLAWSDVLPALRYLDRYQIIGEVSLSDLVRIGVVGIVAGFLFRNLPGLLELGFLRALGLEAGVRNAIVTLCQYVVVALALALIFQALGLAWSQFGWIAAALSVGLGFGLQEVVGNFVSGLILLFERPIRVGDIVTVGGVDGVVTKIRIRATTITNWDKKEFIVPNKEFITGTIMNWTLSSQVTRLSFPVGVAYGTDVEKARSILLEIAKAQPEVLAEPSPVAVFDKFGPSTLELVLRCFVASPDHRLEASHRINTLIHRRFNEAGIEMAFVQHDIHLRSIDPSIRIGISSVEEGKGD